MALQFENFVGVVYEAFAGESLTVSTAAVGGTPATYNPAGPTPPAASFAGKAQRMFVTANDQPCRFRYDGGTPTAAIGHRLGIGETVALQGYRNIQRFLIIREGAVDSNVFITYER